MATLSPWRINMLGGLSAWRSNREIARFQTRKTGSLLGYLSYHLNQPHHRDEIIDQIWPELDADRGRACLSTSVYSLRRQLEPPDVPVGSVLITNRFELRLNPQTVSTDLQEFASAMDRANSADDPSDRLALLQNAINLYRGDLLPGCPEDWVGEARERISRLYIRSVRSAIQILEGMGEIERALEIAMQVSACVPDREEAQYEAIRLLRLVGNEHGAARHYETLEQLLERRWERKPSKRLQTLVEGLERSGETATVRTRKPSISKQAPSTEPTPARIIRGPATAALPVTITNFFGREKEIEQLLQWILPLRAPSPKRSSDRKRLVTLVGPAGSGKTRLALEVAHAVQDQVLNPVVFVSLVNAKDADAILPAVLLALGLTPSPKADPLDQISDGLEDHAAFIVLDNLEHLEDCGTIIQQMLLRLPAVSILTTSRCLVGLVEEQVFSIWPLPFPELQLSPKELLEYSSIRMFLDRVQAVLPSFQVRSNNSRDVAELCMRLEGLPLAIELAAPRLYTLTPKQVLAELGNRFEFLVSKNRCVDSRHGALHTAIEWSYNRLARETQHFFRGLSVFRGGWTLESAKAVCGPVRALDHLEELVRQSLVIAEDRGDSKRYRMLESLREFLQDQMRESERQSFEKAQTVHFREFLIPIFDRFKSPSRQQAILEVAVEKENLRTVLAREVENENGLAIAGMMWPYWNGQGLADEGKEWLTHVLESANSANNDLRLNALQGLSSCHESLGDLALAEQTAQMCLDAARNSADPANIAQTLNLLGYIVAARGGFEQASNYLEESLNHWRAVGNRWAEAGVLNNLGRVAHHLRQLDLARERFNDSESIYRRQGDRLMASYVLNNIALVATDKKNYSEAIDALVQSLEVAEEIGDRRLLSVVYNNLGEAKFRTGELTAAQHDFRRSIRLRQEVGDRLGQDFPITGLGVCICLSGNPVRGVCLISAALEIRKRRCGSEELYEDPVLDGDLNRIRSMLSQKEFDNAWKKGKEFFYDETIQYALDDLDTIATFDRENPLLSALSQDLSLETCKIGI